jgi:hypothetical protein
MTEHAHELPPDDTAPADAVRDDAPSIPAEQVGAELGLDDGS